ncbi:MAG: hypothetical protein AABY22_25280, partial [Nanoarchaeota archaeon]
MSKNIITLKSTELNYYSIFKVVSDLIKKNNIYQLDGKNDRMLVAEVQREMGFNAFSDTITRTARRIRQLRSPKNK